MSDIDAISVANTPGLIGALLIGLTAAKTLSWILRKPLITVNHLHAHIYASKIEYEDIDYPVGGTIDDAAGEAFDKVGKILGLGYPAGPEIDSISQKGNDKAIPFPRSYLKKGSLDFSFSGIKTAVLYHCMGQDSRNTSEIPKLTDQEIADIAASFQEAVVDVLVGKTIFAATKFSSKSIILGGGVACNSRLRQKLTDAAKRRNIPLFYPSKKLCMDNAAMVAGLAFHKYGEKKFSSLDVEAMP